ncbi:hypothetical protein DA717_00680 [Piscirickettsiaceae bacterium NZ-RLO2]|nr:hypothetical protein DA717_00680 [Piscirickettsiaceae bacterium NZ-RLO2]
MRLLFGIGLLIAAVVAGVYLNAYQGEVSVQFGAFLLHVPLWLVMISLIIMITLWIVLKSIVVGLWNYPSRWARSQARRRRAKQKKH